MKKLTCINCPRGCQLQVDDDFNVTGNLCIRGKTYAKTELTDPKRLITTILRVKNRPDCMVSVKIFPLVQKGKIFEVLESIKDIEVKAPIKVGDILTTNVLGLGYEVIATKSIL